MLVLGLVFGFNTAAYAETIWSSSFTRDGGVIDGGVTVTADITVTIPEGKTLSVSGGLNYAGTVSGSTGEIWQAVYGTVVGTNIQESNDNNTWKTISSGLDSKA